MIRRIDFEEAHLKWLVGQGHAPLAYTDEDIARRKRASQYSMTYVDENNAILLVGGVMMYWENRGEAWAVFNRNCGKRLLELTRVVRRFFDTCPVERIEGTVEVSFAKGHRWLSLLGFELEAPRLRKYALGRDMTLYSRVK